MKQTQSQRIAELTRRNKELEQSNKRLEKQLLDAHHEKAENMHSAFVFGELRSADHHFIKDMRDICNDLRNAIDLCNASAEAFHTLKEAGIHPQDFSYVHIDSATATAYSRWFARIYAALINRDSRCKKIRERNAKKGENFDSDDSDE